MLGIEADELHQLLDSALALLPYRDSVDRERIPDDRADAPPWIEGAVRILKNHLHLEPVWAEAAPRQN